jgi:amidohydrolase
MAGLACGETSPLAWRFLQPGVDHFQTVEDAQAVQAMRTLAQGQDGDMPVVAGESGVAGLAALQALRADAAQWAELGLGPDARAADRHRRRHRAAGVCPVRGRGRRAGAATAGAVAGAFVLTRRSIGMYAETELGTQLVRWRRHLHQHPETGFNEHRTADYVAAALESMGLQVHRGIGGTGLVASLRAGTGAGVIGLRADMDALAMTEQAPGRAHLSQNAGCMHGCGHDGHMAMLLGAARLLGERRNFSGTVRFIFQPAEEHGRGAQAMIDDGLFERFPVDEIYGAHNMPGIAAGTIATRTGALMASEDNFVIRIRGRGGHASRPALTIDPLVVGAEIVLALQTIVARAVEATDAAVVSCTEFITDGIRNAIPSNVTIKGDTRSFTPEVRNCWSAACARSAPASPRPMARPARWRTRMSSRPPSTGTRRWPPPCMPRGRWWGPSGWPPTRRRCWRRRTSAPSCARCRGVRVHRQRPGRGRGRAAAAQRGLRLQRRHPARGARFCRAGEPAPAARSVAPARRPRQSALPSAPWSDVPRTC